ncbi:MAG: SDR family oxidoreductase, partial [Spirochaetia bacterium]
TALITGASSGIGKAFAETLAAKGVNVILVARSKHKLDALAAQLKKKHKVAADVIVADLSKEKAPDAVFARVQRLHRQVDILINNAGFGTYGRFHDLSVDDDHREIMLNVVALVRLTHLFLQRMVKRGEGIVVNVASAAAFQPAPFMAVYGASKSFVLSFSEALWAEYRSQGIRVLAVCPGPTETNFFRVAGNGDATVGRKRKVQSVVATALKGLEQGKSYVVDGRLIYLGTLSVRLAPRGVVARSAARIMAPKHRDKK